MRRIKKATIASLHALLIAAMLGSQPGCGTAHYRESADKETYNILKDKSALVPNSDPEFTIDEVDLTGLKELPQVTEEDPALGQDAAGDIGANIVSLEKALELAVNHSRSYQNQKESLYLAALSLTLDRHRYTPIFSGGGGAAYNRSTTNITSFSDAGDIANAAPAIISGIGNLAGTPADLISAYTTLVNEAASFSGADQPGVDIVDQRRVTGSTNLGVDWLLKGGGRIAIDLSSNFLRFLTGDPNVSTSSALVGSFTQPLLRGAGRKVAAERLTQAERDVLYSMRDFARFRKVFTVSIVSTYYSVLRNRDIMRNNYLSYLAFQESSARDRELVVEGRRKQSDLGRVQQAELNAQNSWTTSIQRYQQSLDNFKILLGLPVDTPLVLDPRELEKLQELGLREWTIDVNDAVKVALYSRLDLYNSRDELEDAARQLEVVANSLLPDLDLQISSNVDSKPGDRFQELDFQRARWSAGLNVDLPLDRKQERNNFRGALITLERRDRDLELAVDNVKLEVRNAARNLEDARQTYEIRLLGVQINESRVEEETLLAELGEGDALNLVDAQNDLTAAKNDLMTALINHTIARLEYWRDMGILVIREGGQWQEITGVEIPGDVPADKNAEEGAAEEAPVLSMTQE